MVSVISFIVRLKDKILILPVIIMSKIVSIYTSIIY